MNEDDRRRLVRIENMVTCMYIVTWTFMIFGLVMFILGRVL